MPTSREKEKMRSGDDLAYEAMRLIHAKKLGFRFQDGTGTTWHARFAPREDGEDGKKGNSADQALVEATGQGELKNPMVGSEKSEGKKPVSAMKGKGVAGSAVKVQA